MSYPAESRPRLFVGDRLLEVIDLSERGLRVRQSFAFGTELETGACVFGTLIFFAREPIRITGWVVRASPDDAALSLHCGIPFAVVAEEHERYQ